MDPTKRFVFSVFQTAGLCSSLPARQLEESSRGSLERILGQWGLVITDWVPVQTSSCFATLAYAELQRPGLNLLELRRELTLSLAQQDLQVRVQREDVFLNMHRLL